MRVNSKLARMEIYVPKHWDIEDRMTATLGAIDYKKLNQLDDRVIQVLMGELYCGGNEIILI